VSVEQLKVRVYKTAAVDKDIAAKICEQFADFLEDCGFTLVTPDNCLNNAAVNQMIHEGEWGYQDLAEIYVKNQIEHD